MVPQNITKYPPLQVGLQGSQGMAGAVTGSVLRGPIGVCHKDPRHAMSALEVCISKIKRVVDTQLAPPQSEHLQLSAKASAPKVNV